MINYSHLILRYTKSIILLCIFAFFVAELATHSFDPFHPKSITSACIQATVTTIEKTGWFVLLALLASALTRYKPQHRFVPEIPGEEIYAKKASFMLVLFDPLRQTFRHGRFRRLTYH